MRTRRRRGFTLIEMMIVILIIGLLLVLLLPNLIKGKYQAQWTACVQYERNIAAALESYNAQEKGYPSALSVLTTGSPVFINGIPTCPSNGRSYGYVPDDPVATTGRRESYTIYCQGAHSIFLPVVSPNYPQYNPESGIRQKNASE